MTESRQLDKLLCWNFVLFRQYLVVRIVERIQDLSITNCLACAENQDARFAALHPCQQTPLTERLSLFLPQALTEVLDNMSTLAQRYQKTFWCIEDYVEEAKRFVHQLTVQQILDRQYINEGTSTIFQYDNSWLYPTNYYSTDKGEECGSTATPPKTKPLITITPQTNTVADAKPNKRKKNAKKASKPKHKKGDSTPSTDLKDLCDELFEACREIDAEEGVSMN